MQEQLAARDGSFPRRSRREEPGGSPLSGVGRQQRPAEVEARGARCHGALRGRSVPRCPRREAEGWRERDGSRRRLGPPVPAMEEKPLSLSPRVSGPSGLGSGTKGSAFLPNVLTGSTRGAAASGRGFVEGDKLSRYGRCCWSCLLACGVVTSAPEHQSHRRIQIT